MSGDSVQRSGATRKILNVAGNRTAAITLTKLLSDNKYSHTESDPDARGKLNHITYKFEAQVKGEPANMILISSDGHLLQHEFVNYQYTRFSVDINNVAPLFNVDVTKVVKPNQCKLISILEREAKGCEELILWMTNDREGENMGFEVIDVCRQVNPDIKIHRAKFWSLTSESMRAALANLETPNRAISDAIDVRRELDYRTGRAFTRFQSMKSEKIWTYGSCILPVLSFVVRRCVEVCLPNLSQTIQSFDTIQLLHCRDNISVDFRWNNIHSIETCNWNAVVARCTEAQNARVKNVVRIDDIKKRPLPLNTLELLKTSEMLKLTAKETNDILLKLYDQGVISYPITDADTFPVGFDFVRLVQKQCDNEHWGLFARRVLDGNGPVPRQGTTTGACPPIHPTEKTDLRFITGKHRRVYDFIVRRFLACVSSDAILKNITVSLEIANEEFRTSGISIIEHNYLEVYPYEVFHEIPEYVDGDEFLPATYKIVGIINTNAPLKLLSESELLTILANNRIGTSSTFSEHIEKIKSQKYVVLTTDKLLMPSAIGLGLIITYLRMNVDIMMPDHRRDLETDLESVCCGDENAADVLKDHLSMYRNILHTLLQRNNLKFFHETFQSHIDFQDFWVKLNPIEQSNAWQHYFNDNIAPFSKLLQ